MPLRARETPVRTTTTWTLLLSLLISQSKANWMSSSSNSGDMSVFGNSLGRDWLYNSKAISIQLEGCVWGYVSDNEDAGCMEDESEDGTTYWYQMANCRRAQAAFTMYASSSSSSASCSSGNLKEAVRTGGSVGCSLTLQTSLSRSMVSRNLFTISVNTM